MAVRRGPKIFGEIKTSWKTWLLSFCGSWSGAVQAQVTEPQEVGCRVLGAADFLGVIRVVGEHMHALLTLGTLQQTRARGKREKKEPHPGSALQPCTELRGILCLLGPAGFAL